MQSNYLIEIAAVAVVVTGTSAAVVGLVSCCCLGIMEGEETYTCGICERSETASNLNSMVVCDCCFNSYHLKCKKISKEALNKLSGTPYFCSSECSEIFRRFTTFTANKKLCDADKEYITSTIKDALAEKLDAVLGEIRHLQHGHDEIVKEQDGLKERCSQLENMVSNLEDEVEFLHRDRISNNVMFFGVPMMTGENTTDVVQATINRLTYAQPQLITRNDILSVFRFPPKNKSSLVPPIFKSCDCKGKFMQIVRLMQNLKSTDVDPAWIVNGVGSRIFIRDEATKLSQHIYKELKSKQKDWGIQYVWIGRNSVALIKKKMMHHLL